jgi:hypothetical protein
VYRQAQKQSVAEAREREKVELISRPKMPRGIKENTTITTKLSPPTAGRLSLMVTSIEIKGRYHEGASQLLGERETGRLPSAKKQFW